MIIDQNLMATALQTAFKAGKVIMEVYREHFDVQFKPDYSPITIADQRAHSVIAKGLSETGIPLLSEEGEQAIYETRKEWKQYWLVDPLDGTKEFVKKNGDFTVNIALIRNQKPIFGVVYAPVTGYMYWGCEPGSFRLDTGQLEEMEFENYTLIKTNAEQLPCIAGQDGLRVLGSRSHMNPETEAFIENLKNTHPDLSFVSRGSSLKFCTLAEGGADIYPRFSPTMEWDTAAGHAVALFAGCSVDQVENGMPVIYNKPSLLNPFFIARRKKNEATSR